MYPGVSQNIIFGTSTNKLLACTTHERCRFLPVANIHRRGTLVAPVSSAPPLLLFDRARRASPNRARHQIVLVASRRRDRITRFLFALYSALVLFLLLFEEEISPDFAHARRRTRVHRDRLALEFQTMSVGILFRATVPAVESDRRIARRA